ncbi:MAG: hypothetical protein H0U49_08555 [Parachlamydiaceae bacterium]|nr:hypothetical protein [Parachlamydiaceae bacterium]
MKAKIAKMSIAIASAALSLTGLLSADVSSIQVGTGYRQDSLTSVVRQRSNINPRHKTNLHFRDVEIVLLGIKAKSTFGCCDTYVRADFDYGWVLDGKLREKLSRKDRHQESELCHNGFEESGHFHDILSRNDISTKSFVWDLDVAFIYPTRFGCDDNWTFGPGIGFAVNRQQFHGKDRRFHDRESSYSCENSNNEGNSINECSSSSSSSSCSSDSSSDRHHHHNRTSWWGPWLGFDFAYNSCDSWNLYGEFEFHFGRVRHSRGAHRCDDSDFRDSYNNTRSFWGPSIKVGTTYTLCENWYLDGSIYYSRFFTVNSNRDDIRWATANIRLDIGYTF